jgi:phenylacetic acid degradation operon negative regulatory protein
MSSITEEILLHLYNCVDYALSYTTKRKLFILDEFPREWKDFKQSKIKDGIRDLNKQKFIRKKEKYDGSVLVSLTEKGRLRALNLKFRRLGNKKEKWDGKWRMVAFDIPDECRKGRNILRYRLKMAGFLELQESLFLYPYDCHEEIKNLVDLFKLKKYVCFAIISSIDDERIIRAEQRIKKKDRKDEKKPNL